MTTAVVRAGLGFAFWIIVARFYPEAQVGWGSAIISAITFLALLSTPGFNVGIVRFLPKAEKPVEMINSCLTLVGIIAVVFGAIFVLGLDIWSPALHFIADNVIFVLAFIFFVILLALSQMLDSIFLAARRTEFVLFRVTIVLLLRLPLPILLVLFFHSFGIAASWGIALAVAFAITIFLFVPRVQKLYQPAPKLNLGIIGSMWQYSAGSYLAGLFNMAPQLILPIMVVNLLGAEQGAYYYMAWIIARLLVTIPGSMSQSLFAEGSHFEDQLMVNVRKSLKFIALMLIPVVILVFVLGKWPLLLFGEGYAENSLMLLKLMAISVVFIGINRVYASILRVKNKIRELILIFALPAVAMLLGSYFIMPILGLAGIGYAWLAVHGIVSIYAVIAMRLRHGTR